MNTLKVSGILKYVTMIFNRENCGARVQCCLGISMKSKLNPAPYGPPHRRDISNPNYKKHSRNPSAHST